MAEACAVSHVHRFYPTYYIKGGGEVDIAYVDGKRFWPVEVKPPDVARDFVRAKAGALERFAEEKGLGQLPERDIEDEFVFQNSVRLNTTFYASLGEKQAFVLSHGRNLLIVKIVGYAEAAEVYVMGNAAEEGVSRSTGHPVAWGHTED